MKPWNLNRHLIWVILGPALLLSLLVAGTMLHREVLELNRSYEALAEGLTRQLARASHLALLARDRAELTEIAHSVLATDPIAGGARITPAEDEPVVEIGQDKPLPGYPNRAAAIVSGWFVGAGIPMRYVSQIPPAGEGSPLDPFGTPRAGVGEATLTLSQGHYVNELAHAFYRAATAGMGLFIALSVTGYGIAWFAALPLARMRRRLGELTGTEPVQSHSLPDNYSDIERSLKVIGQRLTRSEDRAREATEALRSQEQQLQQARELAHNAARGRADWVAGMSHELRAPLTAILGHTDLLARTDLGKEQREYLSTVRKSANGLLRLIDDILEWSGLEAGKANVNEIGFNLHETVEETLTLLAPLAYEKDLELVHMIYKDVPVRLRGDPSRFQQILTNLASNAIKFTQHGSVIVRVMKEQEDVDRVTLRVSVADTGPGLSEAEQQRLFRMYERLDTGQQTAGSGLGLAISRRLVEIMGGRIEVNSEPGQGSDFQFVLPMKKSPHRGQRWVPWVELRDKRIWVVDSHATARIALAHQLESWQVQVTELEGPESLQEQLQAGGQPDGVILGMRAAEAGEPRLSEVLDRCQERSLPVLALVTSIENEIHAGLEARGVTKSLPKSSNRLRLYRELCQAIGIATTDIPSEDEPPLAGLNTLLVDNSEATRRYLAALLVELGASVAQAGSGKEAIEAWRKGRFPLVVLDYQMPDGDGPSTVRRLREIAPLQSRPVIIGITADNSAQVRQRFLDSGADDCLVKPFDTEKLLQTIERQRPGRPHGSQPEPSRRTATRDLAADPGLAALLAEEIPRQLDAVEAALGSDDIESAAAEIHSLRGTAAFYSLTELRDAAQRMEAALQQGHSPAAREQANLRAIAESVLAGLRAKVRAAP